MRRYWTAIVAVAVIATTAGAQQPEQAGAPAAASAEVSVGTGIENRALVGAAETFPAGTAKLFCLSRVTNASGSEVEHVWYKGDTEVARVKLMINGSPWRTFSSKTLGDDAAGDWRCEVVVDGKTVQSAKFKVE